MANVKISNLTAAATPLAGTEVLPVVQSGTTVKASIANVQTATYSGGTANGVAYLNGSKVLTTGSALTFDGTNLTATNGATIQGLTVGRGGAGGAANTAYGASAIPIAPNSGVTAIGSNAGKLFNTASDTGQSTFVGYFAGAQVSTGTDSTFVGGSAGTNTTTGAKNTAVGSQALQLNTTASNNTAVGYTAGYSLVTSVDNTLFGSQAGYSTTSAGNTFVGQGAGYYVSSGAKNTIIGRYTGNQGGLDIRTASNYIVLSDGDGNPRLYNAGSYFWSLVGTSASTCGAILFRNSSQTQYWNMEAADTNWYVFGTSTYVYFAQGGSSWVFSSDRRIKENIVDIDYGLNAVMQLKPRRYDNTTNEKNEIGFVAQELRDVIPEAVTGEEIEFDENDTKMERAKKSLGVSKDTLIPVLVKAIQEQQAIITSQAADIAALKAKVGL